MFTNGPSICLETAKCFLVSFSAHKVSCCRWSVSVSQSSHTWLPKHQNTSILLLDAVELDRSASVGRVSPRSRFVAGVISLHDFEHLIEENKVGAFDFCFFVLFQLHCFFVLPALVARGGRDARLVEGLTTNKGTLMFCKRC